MKWEKCKKSPADCAVSHQNKHNFCQNSFSDNRSSTHASSEGITAEHGVQVSESMCRTWLCFLSFSPAELPFLEKHWRNQEPRNLNFGKNLCLLLQSFAAVSELSYSQFCVQETGSHLQYKQKKWGDGTGYGELKEWRCRVMAWVKLMQS